MRFAGLSPEPDLAPRPGIPQPDLRQEIHLSPQAFNAKFKDSPVQRPRRRGYLRNVAVAMGNLADPDCLPDLVQVLREDPEPLVRGQAAWAIGQTGGPAASQALDRALKSEPDPYVLSEIDGAIGQGRK
jgi:epoxyqueuosine reductase